MNHRERLLATLRGEIPDCVPVAPDFSNMIPARLTGKPFWDLYLYNDPPIWEAYVACAKHFDIDSLMDGYFPLTFPEEQDRGGWERFIVFRSPERIVTQASRVEGGKRVWRPKVDVYYVADPPTRGVPPAKVDMPEVPKKWEPLDGVKPADTGPEGLKRLKALMGEQGLVGVFVASTGALGSPEAIYDYYDHPEKHEAWAAERVAAAERRFARIMAMETKPDFLCVGGSGTLVFQTVEIFRQLALPAVKRAIELADAAGMSTQVHSCGPETELVKIMAEETRLTVIDPLEIPPMGDCNLAEIKRLYGKRLTLKGNLHTTEVMLRGSVEDVRRAARKAIDGRDTPDDNLKAMIETARSYGRY
jgi:uroporphyrinogen decarboxylase